MVRHENVGVEPDIATGQAIRKNAFEGFVIGVLAKNSLASVSAIQGVVNAAGFVGASGAWHDQSIAS